MSQLPNSQVVNPFFDQKSKVLYQNLTNDQVGFKALSGLLSDKTGICLIANEKNMVLMASRLHQILLNRSFENYETYKDFLIQSRDPSLWNEFVSALTTNTTSFFREKEQFESLKEIVRSKHGEELRIWCSASSTGQEPYSILMTILESMESAYQFNIKFLATDIDMEVLGEASIGFYSEILTSGLSKYFKEKYFEKQVIKGEKGYRVKKAYRNQIDFAQFNLMAPAYPFQNKFDFIFCRNVLIYFTPEAATDTINKMIKFLKPEGHLFLGASETGLIKSKFVEPVAHSLYKKKGAG